MKCYNVKTASVLAIGQHASPNDDNIGGGKQQQHRRVAAAAVSCLRMLDSNCVASAGWDSKFHVWDVRASSSASRGGGSNKDGRAKAKAVATVDLPGKAFSMDATSSNFASGMMGRVVVAGGRMY